MTYFDPRSFTHQGSILLFVSCFVFILSLAAAGFTWNYFHQKNRLLPIKLPASVAPLADITEAILNPVVEIDQALMEDQSNIQKNLIVPLRQYYATKEVRLVAIKVAVSDDESYPITVLLTLHQDAAEEKLSFYYDFSVWNPSFLEKQEKNN